MGAAAVTGSRRSRVHRPVHRPPSLGTRARPQILASHLHWDKEASEDYEGACGASLARAWLSGAVASACARALPPATAAAVLRQVFQSPGWAAVRESEKSKFELKAGPNTYCMEIDAEGRVFVVVITGAAAPVSLAHASATAHITRRAPPPPSLLTRLRAQRCIPCATYSALLPAGGGAAAQRGRG